MAVDCELRPEQRINEVELAARLNVSRTPVREALNRLVNEGRITLIPNRGFYYPPHWSREKEPWLVSTTPDPDAIVRVYRDLGRLGLNTGSSGNVSQRSGGGMLITPTGVTAETVSRAGLVQVRLDGHVQSAGRPSSEWEMHAGIYAAYPEASAVVHTHADACTALACLGEGLPPFHYMVVGFGGADVRCAPYATFGTPALAASAVTALDGRTACLLANHGMICHGRDPAAALATALALETLARQYLLARSAGSPRLLDPAQLAAAQDRYRDYGAAGAGLP